LGQLSYIHRRTHKLEPNELDEVTQYFTTLIQEAAWYSAPTPKEEERKHVISLSIYVSWKLKNAEHEAESRNQETMTTT
jgi:hypothetical protein